VCGLRHPDLPATGPPQKVNQIVIWDFIAKTPEEAVIKIEDGFNKYALMDQGSELR